MMHLWREVIFDDPVVGVRRVGKISDWDKLPANKSLFCQLPGQGIVIGNLTSQLLSNIMLDVLDQKMARKFKYYGRYVDDFFIVAGEDEYPAAKEALLSGIQKLVGPYGLKLHPKKMYNQKVGKGVPFLGKKVYLTHMTLGKRTVGNYFKAAREVAEGRRDMVSVVSFYGMTAHTSSERLNERVFESVGWRYNR